MCLIYGSWRRPSTCELLLMKYKRFQEGKRKFLLFPVRKRLFTVSKEFDGNIVFWENPPNESSTALGFSYGAKHTGDLIDTYFRHSFCEKHKPQSEVKRCIRPLLDGKRKESSDTDSLCGDIRKGNGYDLILPVNLEQEHICDMCAWMYWKECLHGKA